MKKIRQVPRLKLGKGASKRQMASSRKLSVSTVSEYLYRAGAAGYTWPLPEDLSDEDLERLLFPPRPKTGEPPRPLPDWNDVRKDLSRKGVAESSANRTLLALNPNAFARMRKHLGFQRLTAGFPRPAP